MCPWLRLVSGVVPQLPVQVCSEDTHLALVIFFKSMPGASAHLIPALQVAWMVPVSSVGASRAGRSGNRFTKEV